MEKLINANEGFGVLDRLFAKIQKNNYKATQQMLDEAWSEWIKLDEVNVNNRRKNKMEARRGYVDLILDPADTRKYLVDAFELLYTKCAGVPDKKHGTK